MRIGRGIDDWLSAQHPEIFRLHRHRQNILRLTSTAVESRQFSADDYVRIKRIGDDVTIFFGRDWLPIAKCDLAFIATALDSNRAAFLLPAVKSIRERIVRAHV